MQGVDCATRKTLIARANGLTHRRLSRHRDEEAAERGVCLGAGFGGVASEEMLVTICLAPYSCGFGLLSGLKNGEIGLP